MISSGVRSGTEAMSWYILKACPGMVAAAVLATPTGIRRQNCGYRVIIKFKSSWDWIFTFQVVLLWLENLPYLQ